MVRYYGLYSNAHRGKIHKTGVDSSHPPIIEEEERFVVFRGWAEMIRKVYELDPLLCPSCGGQMRIISFIEDPKVIDKIILHLKLTFQAAQQELLVTAEESGKKGGGSFSRKNGDNTNFAACEGSLDIKQS